MNSIKEFLLKFLFRKAYDMILDQKDLIDELSRKHIENGYHLKEELFLPEEIGFEIHEYYDDAIGYVNVYTKDGWKIIPDLNSTQRGYYSIEMPEGQKFVAYITNSYDGILLFQSLGMDVSIKTIMDDTQISDRIDKFLGIKSEENEEKTAV